MTTQPLPPSVAELRDIIAAHYRGDALNQLCALASRADPAPVADEAAIQEWRFGAMNDQIEHPRDLARESGRRLGYFVTRDEIDEAVRLMRAAPRNDVGRLRKLADWTHRYGSDLVPPSGWSDTYGEGMRNAKEWVRKLLAESPAGDAGEPSCKREYDAMVKLIRDSHNGYDPAARKELGMEEPASAIVAFRLADKLAAMRTERDAAIRDRQDAEALQSKLAADLAAAQKERDEASKIAMVANTEAVRYMRERDEAQADAASKAIDLRHARDDIAAAKAESAKAVVEELEDLKTRLGNVDNCVSWKSSEAMNAQHQERVRTYHQIDRRIAKLRAAQPQPTTAAPATVRQGDEVLRQYIGDTDDAAKSGELNNDENALRELCRRMLTWGNGGA